MKTFEVIGNGFHCGFYKAKTEKDAIDQYIKDLTDDGFEFDVNDFSAVLNKSKKITGETILSARTQGAKK